MPKMNAVLMHGARGGEGRYSFEVSEATAEGSPVRIMRAFMEHVDATADLGHVDYEINAAMKNRALNITTVIGDMILPGDNRQPFACFIGPEG